MILLVMMTLLTRSAPMVLASSSTSASTTSHLYVDISQLSRPFCVTQTYTAYVGAQCSLFCERHPICQDFFFCNTTSSTVTCHMLSEDTTCSNTIFDARKCRIFSKQAQIQQSSALTLPVNLGEVTTSRSTDSEPNEAPSGISTLTCPELPGQLFKNCLEALVYTTSCMQTVRLQPEEHGEVFMARCYFGQTLIQQRSSQMCDSAFFNRSWSEYASGFGELDSCFWLGNDKIRALTNQAVYNLQVKTRSGMGEWQVSQYPMFKVDAAENQYKINFTRDVFYGSSGMDGLLGNKGSPFYTYDENHGTNHTCAVVGGGWWYGDDCDCGNLNDLQGPRWMNNQGSLTFFNESRMAITQTVTPSQNG